MTGTTLHFELKGREDVGNACTRILGEMAVRAGELARQPVNEEAVHEARLLGKRLRALLWLSRPVLARALHDNVKRDLRRASQLLASHRDFAVVCSTLENLAMEKTAENQRALHSVRRSIRSAARRPAKQALRGQFRRSMIYFQRAVKRFRSSADKVGRENWPKPNQRLHKARRQMRRSEKKALRTHADTDFHSWRKRVKRLMYLEELLVSKAKAQQLDQLQKQLGAHHDAVIVMEHISQSKADTARAHRALKLIDKAKARSARRAGKLRRKI